MAKLTAVCRSDDYQFERRQLPLVIDDTLTMVIQFSETCVDCGHMCGVKQKELQTFVRRFSSLSKDEIAVAMMVTSKEILTALAHMVPCVGCRRSVERLFSQLTTSKYPALEPLVIIPGGVLSISSDCLFDPRAIYALFYIHGTQLTSVVDSIPKSKKNKRCMLHSLDTHKSRASSNWMDIWTVLSQECREEVVLVDADCLLDTLDNYLRKHRFCAECKSKVMRAYKILVGDVDCTKEKGYCPGLYEGLRCCPQERHVHIRCSTEFIADLIGRAEPELAGSRRDRHAKTLDIAQEEVLTCLGIHIYDRLHRIWQKLHAEEQTWQILFYLGVDALKKNFELALEKKQGVSNLELMCEELLEEERAKEQKRQQKRQKRKKKRAKTETADTLLDSCIDNCETMPEEQLSCKCEAIPNSPSPTSVSCSPRPVNKSRYCTDPNSNTELVSVQSCRSCNGGRQLLARGADPLGGSLGGSRSSDAGYSSGAEDRCDNCSVPSSNDGSDVVCSDSPTCNHHGCDVLCPSCYVDECKECRTQNDNPSSHSSTAQCKLKYPNRAKHSVTAELSPSNGDISMNGGCRMALTLQDMLEQSCSSEEDAELISEEEIKHFRANQKSLQRERQELRETLRQRFHSLQQRGGRPNDGDEHCSPDLDQLAERLCNL